MCAPAALRRARSAAVYKGEAAAEVNLSEPLYAISQEAHWHPQTMSYQEIDTFVSRSGVQVLHIQIKHPQTVSHQEFVSGSRVRIQELVGAQQHNGKEGVLKSFIEETQRWQFSSPFIFL